MKIFLKVQQKRGQPEYEFDREEDRETFACLQEWVAQDEEQIRLCNINTPGVHVPRAQYLANT